jgi:DNA-3-methyladenine glycosylase
MDRGRVEPAAEVPAVVEFSQPALTLARRLIGATLRVDGVGGRIVETEAYDRDDPASHSFAGPTARNRAMFGEPGRLYVYRSYGIHWCLNIVCGPAGTGQAVLLRAIEPDSGIERMRQRRGVDQPRLLCAGPGRLCLALGVDAALDGHPIDSPPLELHFLPTPVKVVEGLRIGISKATDRPWRFGEAGSRFLSRPFR